MVNDEVKYVVIQWPDIQAFMEYPEFATDCFLVNDERGMEVFGSSAYFVPENLILRAQDEALDQFKKANQ